MLDFTNYGLSSKHKAKQSKAKEKRGTGRSLYTQKIHKMYVYMSTLQMIIDF